MHGLTIQRVRGGADQIETDAVAVLVEPVHAECDARVDPLADEATRCLTPLASSELFPDPTIEVHAAPPMFHTLAQKPIDEFVLLAKLTVFAPVA